MFKLNSDSMTQRLDVICIVALVALTLGATVHAEDKHQHRFALTPGDGDLIQVIFPGNPGGGGFTVR